jgi:hypothetical protein
MRKISQYESEECLYYVCYPQHSVYCVTVYCKIKMSTFVTVATDIGSECEYDEQCSQKLGHAVCTNYQCRCAEGASLNNNTCGKFHT